jgi:Zn-finger protein
MTELAKWRRRYCPFYQHAGETVVRMVVWFTTTCVISAYHRHDIIEILLKVLLNTIKSTKLSH